MIYPPILPSNIHLTPGEAIVVFVAYIIAIFGTIGFMWLIFRENHE